MSGYAIAGFADGFFKGRDWRDSKEDRKLDRERQKRLDEMDAESHDARMNDTRQVSRIRDARENRAQQNFDVTMSETERLRQRRAEEEQFFEGLAEDMGQGAPVARSVRNDEVPIGQPADDPAAPTASGTPVPAQPRRGYSVSPTPQPNERPAPMPGQDQMVSLQGADDALAGGLVVLPQGTRREADEDRLQQQAGQQPTVTEVDPQASAYRQNRQRQQRPVDVGKALSRIRTGEALRQVSPAHRGMSVIKDYFTETPEAGRENAATRETARQANEWYASRDAQEYFEINPDQLEAATADPIGFFQSKDGPVSPELQEFVSSALSPREFGQPATGNVPEPMKVAERSVKQPSPQLDAAASVSTAERVALSFGKRPGQKFNDGQIERGAQAYVDRYYDQVVPQMMQFYTKRGEIDKAQQYAELIESRQGKQAMQAIGRATFHVVNGDYDGAAEDMLTAFKSYGYVDEAMEVDEEATGLVRDDQGQPIGGKVVFRDKKNGNTFEKTFDTPDEFIKYGHTMTSPSMVAELLFAKKPQPKGVVTQQDILDSATEILKADLTGEMTMQAAIQQVMGGLGSLGASMGSGKPQEAPLYRIQQ